MNDELLKVLTTLADNETLTFANGTHTLTITAEKKFDDDFCHVEVRYKSVQVEIWKSQYIDMDYPNPLVANVIGDLLRDLRKGG